MSRSIFKNGCSLCFTAHFKKYFYCIFRIIRIFHFVLNFAEKATQQLSSLMLVCRCLLIIFFLPKRRWPFSHVVVAPLCLFFLHTPVVSGARGYGRLIVTACTCPCAVALLKLDWLKIDLLCFRKGSRRGVCASRRRVQACAFIWVSLFCLHSLADCRSVSGSGKVEQVLLLS